MTDELSVLIRVKIVHRKRVLTLLALISGVDGDSHFGSRFECVKIEQYGPS